jgi:hypothetical protein
VRDIGGCRSVPYVPNMSLADAQPEVRCDPFHEDEHAHSDP